MFCVREVCWFARMHLLQLQVCQHSSDISLFVFHLPKAKKIHQEILYKQWPNRPFSNLGTTRLQTLYSDCRNHTIWNQGLCIFVKPFTSVRKPRSHIAIWLQFF